MKCFIGVLVLQLLTQCSSRGLPDESVVSYQQPGSGDVYHQIANNLAEKLTWPIYRFLGFGKNHTGSLFRKPWGKIETLDESIDAHNVKPLGNDLEDRDIEELSIEALQKEVKKPEKLTLVGQIGEVKSPQNDTDNEIDSLEFDDDEDDAETGEKGREGGFVYFLELIGSFIQLVYGAFLAWFNPPSS